MGLRSLLMPLSSTVWVSRNMYSERGKAFSTFTAVVIASST